MELHEYLLLILVYCAGLLIAGLVYSEIWSVRLNRGKFLKGFDKLLAKSAINKKIERIEKKIDDPNFEKKVGRAVWESTRAEKGGTMKGIYADMKAEAKDMASIESFQHKNLIKLASELDGLIDAGFIRQEWGEKFLKLAQNPAWQPRLDKLAAGVYESIDQNGGNKSYGSGGQKWL